MCWTACIFCRTYKLLRCLGAGSLRQSGAHCRHIHLIGRKTPFNFQQQSANLPVLPGGVIRVWSTIVTVSNLSALDRIPISAEAQTSGTCEFTSAVIIKLLMSIEVEGSVSCWYLMRPPACDVEESLRYTPSATTSCKHSARAITLKRGRLISLMRQCFISITWPGVFILGNNTRGHSVACVYPNIGCVHTTRQ